MDKDRFPLASSREPNPLRPYYIPPSIGPAASTSASPSPSAPSIKPTSPSSSFSTSARDFIPEIDIDIKSTTSEAWQHTRTLFDTLVWRYTSVLLAQPFDVAKTLLQISLPPSSSGVVSGGSAQKRRISPRRTQSGRYGEGVNGAEKRYTSTSDDSDSDSGSTSDDVQDYFTSTAPSTATRSRSPRRRKRTPPRTSHLSSSRTPTPKDRREQDAASDASTYALRLKKPDSITQTLSALYNTSGAVGLWRATNCTFLYSILQRTTDSFLRSLLLAIVGLPELAGPDPGGLGPSLSVTGAGFSGIDVSDSPNPLGSLLITGLASCLTGLLLAPLDLVRTRLILTPTSHPPRGLVQNLRALPSAFLAPSILWLPTAIYHALPSLFSASAPLILRRQLKITPDLTPALWSLAAFTTSLTDLFLRLPLETLVRRAQATALKSSEPGLPTVVPAAEYTGVWRTVYGIMFLEGETGVRDAKAGVVRTRRGQGVAGLVRGWRIGFWGLVGVWGGGALGPGDGGRGGGKGAF